MIHISEVFKALQGEGVNAGFPSIFIRLGGCNLKCEGFGCEATSPIGNIIKGCDSIHSVNREFESEWNSVDTFSQLTEMVTPLLAKPDVFSELQDIVFTGGEPLLNHDNHVLYDTVSYYISRGHRVWFETNGTIDIDFSSYPVYKKCNFVISPKLTASGESLKTMKRVRAADKLLANTEQSIFKFVVGHKVQTELKLQVDEVIDYLHKIPTYAPVYLMAMGETSEELIENAEGVYEQALKHGFRYSDRLHIRVYDDMRGV